MATVRRRVVVHGHVQGVFFRDTARRLAECHAVAGWIRNNPDGTVEAVFEGGPDDVDLLVQFCRTGPRGAVVDRIAVEEEEPDAVAGFAVL